MTTIYSSVSVSGYNASPPADDGSVSAGNQVTWAKHKTKLGDPIKTALESINTNLVTAFGRLYHNATTALSVDTTLAANDRGKTYTTTNSITLTLPPAATAGNNYVVTIINKDGGTVTIEPDGSEEINGAANYSFSAINSILIIYCDGTEYFAGPNVALIDEDDFASDTVSAAPTQQSAKAYIATKTTGRLLDVQTFTTAGGTWTKPAGAGAYKIYFASGSAGGAASDGTDGVNGGATSIGSVCSATGGTKGAAFICPPTGSTGFARGADGAATSATVTGWTNGGNGGSAVVAGNGFFGEAGGKAPVCYKYTTSMGATETITVGAGGAGGTAGASHANGEAGEDGFCIIESYS